MKHSLLHFQFKHLRFSFNKTLCLSCFSFNQTLCMDKLQLTGRALGRVFNFRSGCMHTMHLLPSVAIRPNLEQKTQPKQLLGSLLLVIALPTLCVSHFSFNQTLCILRFSFNQTLCLSHFSFNQTLCLSRFSFNQTFCLPRLSLNQTQCLSCLSLNQTLCLSCFSFNQTLCLSKPQSSSLGSLITFINNYHFDLVVIFVCSVK